MLGVSDFFTDALMAESFLTATTLLASTLAVAVTAGFAASAAKALADKVAAKAPANNTVNNLLILIPIHVKMRSKQSI